MKFTRRRAVSPIIASLLLIAIAVAAGIIVYVYVNSLAGGLTSGGGQQVSQQLQLQSYSFNPISGTGTGRVVDAFLENVGSSSITISNIYIDGIQLTEWGINTGPPNTYGRDLMVPNGAGIDCFAAIASTVNVLIDTTTQTQTSSGTSWTSCTLANVSGSVVCTGTDLCVDTGATAGNQNEVLTIAAQGTVQIVISLGAQQTAGTSHTIKVVSATGSQAVFTVVAGRAG